LGLVLVLIGCQGEVQLADLDGSYALPLVDSEINIVEIAESANQSIIISEDANKQLTVSYLGDVISQTVFEIFPPVPWLSDIVFPETSGMVPLPFDVPFTIKRAKFSGTRIKLKYTSPQEEDITVKFSFVDVFKDGVVFEQTHTVVYNGSSPTVFESDFIDMTDWELVTDTNEFLYTIDARNAAGEIVELDYAAMFLEVLSFSYIEGFFGERVFDLEGDVITVGVFNKWLSGGFVFEEPTVRFIVENSFGFPVRSQINDLTLTTLSGEMFSLEADGVEEGILFNFPSFEEVGEIKETVFVYSKENSNIGEAFNEKAVSIRYDVDAVTNSEVDPMQVGFLTDSSYYRVQVSLDVPLNLRLNDLKLTDTFDLDLSQLADYTSADFKFITENSFPFEVELQTEFLDTINNTSVSLFENELLMLASAELGTGGAVTTVGEVENIVPVDSDKMQKIANAQKVAIIATFSNSEISPEESFWILSTYGIKLRLGAILRNE